MIRVAPVMKAALLSAARTYAAKARVPLRSVSRRAYGDSRFFTSVARGGSFSAKKYDEVMAYFANPKNWPGELVPDSIIDPFANLKLDTCKT